MPAPFPGQQPLQASRHTRHIPYRSHIRSAHGEYALVGQREPSSRWLLSQLAAVRLARALRITIEHWNVAQGLFVKGLAVSEYVV